MKLNINSACTSIDEYPHSNINITDNNDDDYYDSDYTDNDISQTNIFEKM